MLCIGTLLRESIITGIIISDVTMIMEIGGDTNISDRDGMERIGKVMGGADLRTTLQTDHIRETGTDLSITHRPDRIREIGTGPLTMCRIDKNTATGADPLAIHLADLILVM